MCKLLFKQGIYLTVVTSKQCICTFTVDILTFSYLFSYFLISISFEIMGPKQKRAINVWVYITYKMA